jgi:hypothetical protein
MVSRDCTSPFMARASSSSIHRSTYAACAAASLVAATVAAATTGTGLLAGEETRLIEPVVAGETGATVPLSTGAAPAAGADAGDVDCGRRVLDAKTITPNKPAATSNMATTTFGLILQRKQSRLRRQKKLGSIRANPVSNQFKNVV